jgi:hypothetical protein
MAVIVSVTYWTSSSCRHSAGSAGLGRCGMLLRACPWQLTWGCALDIRVTLRTLALVCLVTVLADK